MDPARMFKESLTSRPELENSQGHSRRFDDVRAMSGLPPIATEMRTSLEVRFVPIVLKNSAVEVERDR
jgi:hypothetical protein